MTVLESIGSEIKSARERSDLSLEDLATETKISLNHLKNIEEGNRSELPEEAYLHGYLNKLLKTLRFNNAKGLLEHFKQQEANLVLEEIINDSDIDEEPEGLEFTHYHLYAIIAVLFLGLTWFAFSMSQNKVTKPSVSFETRDLANSDLPDFVKGMGSKQLDVEVIDNAWYKVVGVNQEEILFEGDVYYDHGYKVFRFFDDTGFVFSTDNAGAFKVKADSKDFVLGLPGQEIQWFYPESIKQFYIKPEPVIVEQAPVKKKKRKLFGRFRRKRD